MIQDKCSLSLSRLNEFLLNYNIFRWYGTTNMAFRSVDLSCGLPRCSNECASAGGRLFAHLSRYISCEVENVFNIHMHTRTLFELNNDQRN